jgi:ribulose-phosphate 3-epimerase
LKNSPEIKIAPSILSADFARLGEQVAEASRGGADYIHVDVMDGHFVPPITIGALVVAAIRKYTELPLDVHLMITSPEKQIGQFIDAGADIITVHFEAYPDIRKLIRTIKNRGIKAGISINPPTPVERLYKLLSDIDLALVMTVNPGYGGQPFINSTLAKITSLRAEIDRQQLEIELEVDGGINARTAPEVVKAGASVLVAGAAVFSSGLNIKEAIGKLRESFV